MLRYTERVARLLHTAVHGGGVYRSVKINQCLARDRFIILAASTPCESASHSHACQGYSTRRFDFRTGPDDLKVVIDGSPDEKERKNAEKIMPLRKRGNLLLCTLLLGNTLVNAAIAVRLRVRCFLDGR